MIRRNIVAVLLGMVLGTLITSGFVFLRAHTNEKTYSENDTESSERSEAVHSVVCDHTHHTFISERCGQFAIDKRLYIELEQTLAQYINDKVADGSIAGASTFFRDLVDGPTFSVYGYVGFVPASLLKTPFAFAYFDQARNKPDLLSTTLTPVDDDFVLGARVNQYYVPPDQLIKGESYTIENLLFRLLAYSDNVAGAVLVRYLDALSAEAGTHEGLLLETYKELGLIPELQESEYVITIRQYAGLFRTLYFSSFLDPDDSEKVLSMLASSTYREGLVAGVPSSTVVAHKFGETISGQFNQLHDCGIVYFPQNPYLLCVMTRGYSFETLSSTIAHISKLVYDEVNVRRKNVTDR
jgi:beta-lactamase class A